VTVRAQLPNLWVDINDLFDHAAGGGRMSGIQRVVIEICHAFRELPASQWSLRFVRHDGAHRGFAEVSEAIAFELFGRLTGVGSVAGDIVLDDTPPTLPAEPSRRSLARRVARRLPADVRLPLYRGLKLQTKALRELRELATALGRRAIAMPRARAQHRGWSPAGRPQDFARSVTAGDVVFVPGAPWAYADYASLVAAVRQRYGVRFALFVHDLLPVRRPEFFAEESAPVAERWFVAVLPQTEMLLTFSKATARDFEAFMKERQIAPAPTVQAIPGGAGFVRARQGPTPEGWQFAARRDYALCVSTLEPRKNHALLFRVWQKMLENMPRAKVPLLVFAGRTGWLADDLMQQMKNTGFVGGKIQLVEDAGDDQLAEIYRHCLFTVFPSFGEGWGLPVSESLAFGKPCFASDVPAITEAGGTFARYFDPNNASSAYALIRATIDDPQDLQTWSEEIARSYAPVPWVATAEALVAALDRVLIHP
jgi:glycosyltransferase involved in cell wall biosynthesis